jgi:hypothetical protein
MADLNDLHQLALALPETFQEEGQLTYAVQTKSKPKSLAWVWKERIDPKKARVPNPAVIAIRVRNNLEKEMLIEAEPTKFFTEPHYNGFPAILVRLAEVDASELEALLLNAWRCQAPAALVKAFDQAHGLQP